MNIPQIILRRYYSHFDSKELRLIWEKFCSFAESDGVSLEDEDDWLPSWNCWMNGFEFGRAKVTM